MDINENMQTLERMKTLENMCSGDLRFGMVNPPVRRKKRKMKIQLKNLGRRSIQFDSSESSDDERIPDVKIPSECNESKTPIKGKIHQEDCGVIGREGLRSEIFKTINKFSCMKEIMQENWSGANLKARIISEKRRIQSLPLSERADNIDEFSSNRKRRKIEEEVLVGQLKRVQIV